ncbi:MAG: PAS domain-containing sensor histidine kinase [Desulfovibrionaceae bacterium]
MPLRTIRTRLLLGTIGLFLAAMATVFIVATQAVNTDLEHDALDRARRELATVKWLVVHHEGFDTAEAFDAWVKELGQRLGTRVTFISEGRVLADSMVGHGDLELMDDHSQRPEILGASTTDMATSRRFSATLGRDMLYAAVGVPPVAGLPGGYVRLAVPLSEVSERVDALRVNLLLLFCGVLGVAGLLLVVLSRSVSRSITAFSAMAHDMGQGDYSRRIREVPAEEFAPLADALNAMARSIEHHVSTIEDQRGRLRAMFEGLTEGVLVLDAQGHIESFNRAMAEMFPQVAGYVGRTPLEATRELAIQDVVERVLREGGPAPAETSLAATGGRHLDVSAVAFTAGESGRKLVLVLRDVTEAKRSERMLRDFVANASHQLRTPLTSIRGYAETLLASPPDDPEAARGFLSIIVRNSKHMAEVITSLLALAKSEQLKARRSRPVDACAVLRQAAANLAPHAATRHMRLEVELPEEPVFVRADAEGLLHVLHNLVENAVKYGPEHSAITLCAELEGERAVFHVCDAGGGIAEQHRERIFERFYRVDENAVTGDGSAGLGLAICRQIVENYGGEIACLPRADAPETTCFRFVLKTAPAPKTPNTTAPAAQ